MAPKRKSRVSNTASPAPTPKSNTTVSVEIERRRPLKPDSTPAAPTPTNPSRKDDVEETVQEATVTSPSPTTQLINDPWTDDEEIGLFKALIHWKPTGMHKHFHMLSLHQHLLSNGYVHPRAPHTRISGVWAKLRTLYDLDALDEREDAHAAPWSEESEDDDEEAEYDGDEKDDKDDEDEDLERLHSTEFELPEMDYGELIWRARFPSSEEDEPEDDDERDERDESPALQPELLAKADEPPIRFTPSFAVAEDDDVRATPSGPRTAKNKALDKAKSKAGTRRSSRVADSVDPDEDAQDEAESEAGSAEESERGSTMSGTPAPKGAKGKGKRAKAAPKARTSKRRR